MPDSKRLISAEYTCTFAITKGFLASSGQQFIEIHVLHVGAFVQKVGAERVSFRDIEGESAQLESFAPN